ncbi:MAG: Modification methylase bstVI [Firmicutes bacterium]|nr:Modification methylase bstVI [Bacillota bacterium]MDI6705835.1 N-6 DNA methylase [Bacillota bacterium]
MGESIKKQLEDLYYRKYQDPEDINGSAYRFVDSVIEILYSIIQGTGSQERIDEEICGLAKALLDTGGTTGINHLAECYQNIIHRHSRKKWGRFYTPEYLAGYIVDRLLEEVDIVKTPQVRFFDPSCGGGIFLVKAFERLKYKILSNITSIRAEHPSLNLDASNIGEFVIGNLYGVDNDALGVKLAGLQLYFASGVCMKNRVNICKADALTAVGFPWGDIDFDIIAGNPPYIGHKKLAREYRDELKKLYPDVLTDKADIYCCFIKKSIGLLRKGGLLSFIVSRYLAEAPGAKGIRKFLLDMGHMEEIIDFYGNRTLDGVQVDPMVFFYKAYKERGHTSSDNVRGQETLTTRVVRVKDLNLPGDELISRITAGGEKGYTTFELPWAKLNADGWRLSPPHCSRIVDKIESQCDAALGDLVCSFQGIITGCDRAFVLDKDEAEGLGLDASILKKWIKSSHIKRYRVKDSDRRLMYTDGIDDIDEYPGVKKHIMPYKVRLENRRECVRGFRKWYELQWGRTNESFERHKVVYPYKSPENRFAIDREKLFFSADVYSFYLKEEYEDRVSLEYIIGLLNSKLYDFYFKTFGKKLGMDMYEYYPNTVMRLGMKLSRQGRIEDMVKDLIQGKGTAETAVQRHLDRLVYDLFGLTQDEVEIVEECSKKGCG